MPEDILNDLQKIINVTLMFLSGVKQRCKHADLQYILNTEYVRLDIKLNNMGGYFRESETIKFRFSEVYNLLTEACSYSIQPVQMQNCK